MSVVIKVENLSKQYRLGNVGLGTLSHDLNRWWYNVRGKEDPYLKIGEENDRSKKALSEYVWALRDINFEVKQGEVLGIIGRNGAGKSTLLKILSRTTTPTTGQVKIKGKVASLLEVGTGFHPELTGRENIFLNGAILGMHKKEIQQKFDEIVDFSCVERYIDTPVKRYSSGMYVRLAFAVAAHLEPDILIVDEVLSVGDAEFQKKCISKMKDVSDREGRTVLFVSHNMEAVKKLCKRGILFQNGLIKLDDSIERVYSTYVKTYNKYFVGDNILSNYSLNEKVELGKFRISKTILNEFDDLEFEIEIASKDINPFNGVSILFYNISDERVAIVDLRCMELSESSKVKTKITISGVINNIGLIEGDYFLGLAVGSELCSNNYFNLLHISINKKTMEHNFENYDSSVLGYVNMKSSIKIS